MSITPDERARRKKAFTFARNNVRLEGLEIDPDTEALFQRYSDGDISAAMLEAEIVKGGLYMPQPIQPIEE
jgi:hypothetical protein